LVGKCRKKVRSVTPASRAQSAWTQRLPVPIDGLCLGGAGCHGGPGITFTPGYNAAYQAIDDAT
jgi:phytoene dehydrogenase-like protein